MIDQVFPTITEDGEGMYMTIPFADGVRTIGVNSGSSNAGNHYYESKGYKLIDSSQELTEEEKINYYPSIKVLEDVAENIKNDLLNGAGEAYDTLKELGDLIDINSDALNVLNTVAIGKQDKIKGTEGQTVGFDENGNAIAKDMI